MLYTGIPINFGITAFLGFLVGTAIAGQTFYNFTLENLRQFGALKAMGATNFRIVSMILLQALIVGLLGYGLGVGLASVFGWLNQSPASDLGFFYRGLVPWVAGGLVFVVVTLGLSRIVSWSVTRHAILIVLFGYCVALPPGLGVQRPGQGSGACILHLVAHPADHGRGNHPDLHPVELAQHPSRGRARAGHRLPELRRSGAIPDRSWVCFYPPVTQGVKTPPCKPFRR